MPPATQLRLGLTAHPAAPAPVPPPVPGPVPSPSPPAPGPAPEPAPAPQPGPPPAPADEGGGGGWGIFDLPRQIIEAIIALLDHVITSGLRWLLELLGNSLLATPDPGAVPRLEELWRASLWIANTCLVLFTVAGGLLVMGHQSVQTQWTLREVAPRLVLGAAAANFSWVIVTRLVEIANALSAALLSTGTPGSALSGVSKLMVRVLTPAGGLFLRLIALAMVVLLLAVVITWVVRLALTFLLVAAAPLALVCHMLPHTDGLGRLWWRAICGVLAIQCGQALVLAAMLKIFFRDDGGYAWLGFLVSPVGLAKDLMDLLILAVLLYVLVRVPFWVSRRIFTGTSPLARLGRLAAMTVAFRHLGSAMPATLRARGLPEAANGLPPGLADAWRPLRPAKPVTGPHGQMMFPIDTPPGPHGPVPGMRERLGDLPETETGPARPGPGQPQLPLTDMDGNPLAGWGPISRDAKWRPTRLPVKAERVPKPKRRPNAPRLGDLPQEPQRPQAPPRVKGQGELPFPPPGEHPWHQDPMWVPVKPPGPPQPPSERLGDLPDRPERPVEVPHVKWQRRLPLPFPPPPPRRPKKKPPNGPSASPGGAS